MKERLPGFGELLVVLVGRQGQVVGCWGAPADVCDLACVRVIWLRSGYRMAKDPGAKLDAA
jgi:hypothetical protein